MPLSLSAECDASDEVGTRRATSRNAHRYEAASSASTAPAPITTTRTPPRAGPTKLAVSLTEFSTPPARVRLSSSSPAISASTNRCDDEYAGKNPPTRNAMVTMTARGSAPSKARTGTEATRQARARSETSIIRRAPKTVAMRPPHRPSSAIPKNSAASTAPMRAADPVETRTSHGSATAVISVPIVEIRSAASSPLRPRATGLTRLTLAERRGWRRRSASAEPDADARQGQGACTALGVLGLGVGVCWGLCRGPARPGSAADPPRMHPAHLEDKRLNPAPICHGDDLGRFDRSARASRPPDWYRFTHRCTACRKTPNRRATSTTGTPAWTSRTPYRCSMRLRSTNTRPRILDQQLSKGGTVTHVLKPRCHPCPGARQLPFPVVVSQEMLDRPVPGDA